MLHQESDSKEVSLGRLDWSFAIVLIVLSCLKGKACRNIGSMACGMCLQNKLLKIHSRSFPRIWSVHTQRLSPPGAKKEAACCDQIAGWGAIDPNALNCVGFCGSLGLGKLSMQKVPNMSKLWRLFGAVLCKSGKLPWCPQFWSKLLDPIDDPSGRGV